jgi:regulator of sirC expression with transglutaminase-like and TPR domain
MIEEQKERELLALIDLLDEPEEETARIIQQRVLEFGIDAIPALSESLDNTFENPKGERLKSLINELKQNGYSIKLKEWRQSKEHNLFEAILLINSALNPSTNERESRIFYENLKKDVWVELNTHLTSLEKVRMLNHVIFQANNFASSSDYYLTDYDLLNILRSRKGHPLTMSLLYLMVAQDLKLPVYGGNVPRHMILTWVDEENTYNVSEDVAPDVMFYINPNNDGVVFTRMEVGAYLADLYEEESDQSLEYYQPVGNIGVLKRVLKSLRKEYYIVEDEDACEVCDTLLKVLA